MCEQSKGDHKFHRDKCMDIAFSPLEALPVIEGWRERAYNCRYYDSLRAPSESCYSYATEIVRKLDLKCEIPSTCHNKKTFQKGSWECCNFVRMFNETEMRQFRGEGSCFGFAAVSG